LNSHCWDIYSKSGRFRRNGQQLHANRRFFCRRFSRLSWVFPKFHDFLKKIKKACDTCDRYGMVFSQDREPCASLQPFEPQPPFSAVFLPLDRLDAAQAERPEIRPRSGHVLTEPRRGFVKTCESDLFQ